MMELRGLLRRKIQKHNERRRFEKSTGISLPKERNIFERSGMKISKYQSKRQKNLDERNAERLSALREKRYQEENRAGVVRQIGLEKKRISVAKREQFNASTLGKGLNLLMATTSKNTPRARRRHKKTRHTRRSAPRRSPLDAFVYA